MTDKFIPKDPQMFYKDKGLKRIPIAITENSMNFFDIKRKEFSKTKVTKYGDIIDAIVNVYEHNPDFAKIVDGEVFKILDKKVIEKAGRKEGWRKNKSL
ncbi:hypothetical protein [Acinetobacter junii]|uniref:hypothetical protein n=1 Tax=Acinetobacter junii TaxID=40215 RepID=UPI00124EF5BE|nr:hypothetical protein [Acinetobacter junii]MDH1689986.1 hypothetical protein [Acinetobacter junii]